MVSGMRKGKALVVKMENCLILETNTFESRRGTECGTVRWQSVEETKLYRTMVFGESDVKFVESLKVGAIVDLVFVTEPSRRDDTLGLYLVGCEG